MGDIALKDLLEAGVHFGHQTKRWNPKMKPYIFMERNGIHIIDLRRTLEALVQARDMIRKLASEGKSVLFLGTKTQAKSAVKDEAERSGMPYVTERWLGGTLTNFETVRKSLSKLEHLESLEAEGKMEQFKKKEALRLTKEREKLLKALGGIRKMDKLPAVVFVIDTTKEYNAVREAIKLNIPIVAMVDTNADPGEVTYPIPANDDAMRAIKLFCKVVADAVLEGHAQYLEEQEAQGLKAAKSEGPEEKESVA
jgi:small subunit ribosomal protein S2